MNALLKLTLVVSVSLTLTSTATMVAAQENSGLLDVPLIGLTATSRPTSLPQEGGEVVLTYRVNNPGSVSLSNVMVRDERCSALSGKLGDTNGNNLLDVSEVWLYTCKVFLRQPTTNAATVTAFANNLRATADSVITVSVGNPNLTTPRFPNTGAITDPKMRLWAALVAVLVGLLLVLGVIKKLKARKTTSR